MTWQDNSDRVFAAATDVLSVVAYNDDTGEEYLFENCTTRGGEQGLLIFPDYFATGEVHLWATFE